MLIKRRAQIIAILLVCQNKSLINITRYTVLLPEQVAMIMIVKFLLSQHFNITFIHIG